MAVRAIRHENLVKIIVTEGEEPEALGKKMRGAGCYAPGSGLPLLAISDSSMEVCAFFVSSVFTRVHQADKTTPWVARQ